MDPPASGMATERRQHPRVRCRTPVQLSCPGSGSEVVCRVRDLSPGGLFALGQPAVAVGASVGIRISLGERELSVRGWVVRVTQDGMAVDLAPLGAQQSALVDEIMRPRWDGRNLLEGVMILASDAPVGSLSDWLRLIAVAEYLRRHRH